MIKRLILVTMLGLMLSPTVKAQGWNGLDEKKSFWRDWYVQMGLDMSLQNPYGYDFSKVFPNGKTFGVDLAVGKWFAPEIGVRGKFNWENGIGLFRNDHANWLAPFNEPGVNMDKGGYIAMYGDLLVNLNRLFGPLGTSEDGPRTWNISAYPRVGVNYNFGVDKGALLIGAGLLNTYRLSDRWSVYLDVAYMLTGSGFVGSKDVEGTGTGSNSNGYFSIGLGAQMALGKVEDAVVDKERRTPFWSHWFMQAGLDMSLMNPYGCNFSEVFPKGNTYGLNIAAGRWFTPEFAVRARVQWENGLIENKSIEWVPPTNDPRQNYKSGGFGTAALDAMLSLTNVIAGYQEDRKWNTNAFVRAGLISQFEAGSASPLMGAGLEETYRLNDKLSLFASAGYQVTTSESSGGRGTGMEVAAGSNGFFDIDLGIVVKLGK